MDHPEECLIIGFSTLGVVQMPHKFNAARRHKFDKVQYRVINWAEYNESLRQRGDLTIWVSEEAQSVWSAPRRTSRGGQRRYSDLAIETCLMLRTAYHLGLRQTQGLMGSIGTLMGLDIRVPDYSTLSRRANGVSIAQVMRQAGSVPIHLVVDSTGLKIFGEGEWLAQKHNTKGIRRRWRKLHLGLDLASGAIVCAALTRPCCMDHPEECLIIGFSTLGVVQMPHKFNAARRHKFDKVQYRVINWAEYNESLRQRGDLTIWVSEEAQSVWSAPRRTSRGGQRRYSDLAIETCLMLRTAYHLGLRQTQGLMGSIGTLMGLDIRVPDYSTLSRRANGVSIAQVMRQAGSVPIHLVVDSTGLKIFGEGEWLAQKHNTKGIRRRWRKLHLGLDLASGAIVCAALTHDNVGDSTALPGLLDQLDAPVTGFLADGAYDGASTRNLLRQRYGETLDVVIPPPKDAVIRLQSARDATVRDRHIAQIRSNGCIAWQTATGYNQRSRIETQMGRWKSVIGPKLKSRSFSRQITEVQLGRKVLNTMTALGRPVFERIS